MEFRTLPYRTRALTLALALWGGLALGACGDSATGPNPVDDNDGDPPADTLTPIGQLPATSVTRDDLEPSGTVVETADGYTVVGELAMATSDTSEVRFVNADLHVRFDDQGRVRSISGTAEIASPHERIEIEDPVRADVGFFPGAWLNQNRDLGILLRDDTDYFIFDFQAQLKMNVATGETGENATKPVSVKAPIGGRALMVVDYTDPMYYVYGEQDLLGSIGTGWSLKQRIPFRPDHPVAVQDFGAFDGGSIRNGSVTIFKVFSVSGVVVDNEYTEVHMNTADPLASDLRAGYRQGFNGALEFDLGIKDMVGIALPIASASGGVWAEASVQDVFNGYAYAAGATADFSWWPGFIPAKPTTSLDALAYVTSEGNFEVGLEGTYGWVFPDGEESMTGVFNLSNDGMLLEGRVVSGDVEYALGGRVTEANTRVYFQPPQQLLDEIAGAVNDEVLPRIEEAEQAWNDLQAATGEYEFELSLRGLRDDLPRWVDEGVARLTAGVNSAIASQDGKVWESDFRSKIRAADNVYYDQLAQLKAAAQNATDNATTRTVLERELREMAARKIFTFTYTYKDPIFGTTLYSTTVTRRILSDDQANRLIEAANNVYRIQETSDLKIQLQDVYDTVNERDLFEEVRDDLQDGLLVMRGIEELGFVVDHDQPAFALYARIDGTVHQAGTIRALTIAELMLGLPDAMIDALRIN
ncbi:MAG: hypothetical protein RQ751_06020 [Longimicrobiales bacterium]|nr:hypothetical protein [Longimicrobiales bacterium]